MSNIEEGSKKDPRGPNFQRYTVSQKELNWDLGCPYCGKPKGTDGKQPHEDNCDFMSRVLRRQKYYKDAGLTHN